MTLWKYPILEAKRAPRSFKCCNFGNSFRKDCKGTIEQGDIYWKTNYGRYCDSCGKKLSTVDEVNQVLSK